MNYNCSDFQTYKKLKIDSSGGVTSGTTNELVNLSEISQYVDSNVNLQSNQIIPNCNINQNNEKVVFTKTCTTQNIPDYTTVTIQPNNQIISGFNITTQQVNGNVSINGVPLQTGDYVFVNRQTDTQTNGIYKYLKIGDSQNVIICGGNANTEVVIPPGTVILGPNSSPSPPNNQGLFPNGNGCYPDTNGQYPNQVGLYPMSIPGNSAIYPVFLLVSIFNGRWYYPVIIGGNIFYPNSFGFYPNNSFLYIVSYPSQLDSIIGGESLHFLRDTGMDYRHPRVTIIPKLGEALFNNQQTDVSFIWKRDTLGQDFTFRRDIYGKYATIPLRNNDPSDAEQLFAGFNEYRFTNVSTTNNNIIVETRDNASWKVGQYKVIHNDTPSSLIVDFDLNRSFDIAIGKEFVTSEPENFVLTTNNASIRLTIPSRGRIIFWRTPFEKLIQLVAATRGNRFQRSGFNYFVQ